MFHYIEDDFEIDSNTPINIPINYDAYKKWLFTLSFNVEQYNSVIYNHHSNDWKLLTHPRSCTKCGRNFLLSTSLGRWECQHHPGIREIRSGNGGEQMNTWSCCGLQNFNPYNHRNYEKKYISGCKRSDHHMGTFTKGDAVVSIPMAIYIALKFTKTEPILESIESINLIQPSQEDINNYKWETYNDNPVINDNTQQSTLLFSSSLLIHKLTEEQESLVNMQHIDLSKSNVIIKSLEL